MNESQWLQALGRTIRIVRDKKGYSQELLAESTGLNRTTISLIETGQANIVFSNLVAISESLGISPTTLMAMCECEL